MYYLDNFETALRWVYERYADLLDTAECEFLLEFARLPRESKALLVRLVMRKGDVFRESRIRYPELGDLATAVAPLIGLGWVDAQPLLSLEELFRLLTRLELAKIFDLLRSGVRKADALTALRATQTQAQSFEAWRGAPVTPERVYRVSIAALCSRFRILFFGNFRQEWSEFVLAELGVFRYEKVEFSRDSRAFQTRQDILHLNALFECRRQFYAEQPLSEVLAILPRTALGNEWLEARRAKLLFQIAQAHERAGEREQALCLYAESSHPGARLRLIRLMELAKRDAEVQSLLAAALHHPQSEGERQKLLRIRERVERRSGALKHPASRKFAAERMDCRLPMPGCDTSVEFAVLAHLSTGDAPVFYVENTLINSLFGLLFWDAIFAAVRGAFFHPFQSGPADLYSVGFKSRREVQFEAGFAALLDGSYRSVIERRFVDKRGIQSPFVFWGTLSESLLDVALDCIPPLHLQRCFERLLLDLNENRSGLPDLIQFWPAERRYRMIEVKGPGDKVQDNQQRWMEYCSQHSIPVTVCHASWSL